MSYIEREVFHCVCCTPGHHFFVWESIDHGVVDDVTIEVHLDNFLPFYKRLWVAVKYLFKKSTPGCYNDILLEEDELRKLISVLTKSLGRMKKIVDKGGLDAPYKRRQASNK